MLLLILDWPRLQLLLLFLFSELSCVGRTSLTNTIYQKLVFSSSIWGGTKVGGTLKVRLGETQCLSTENQHLCRHDVSGGESSSHTLSL